jgi:hypothetical protein
VNRFTNKTLDSFERPHPSRLASPFEAIRSAEILPVFLERFEIVERSESNALLHIICPPGYRPNYIEQPNGQVIFDLLHYLDRLVIRKDILPPLGGQYIMRPRR